MYTILLIILIIFLAILIGLLVTFMELARKLSLHYRKREIKWSDLFTDEDIKEMNEPTPLERELNKFFMRDK